MVIIGVRKSKGVVNVEKVELSKPLSLSRKYQITVPEHVRTLMGLNANDKVMFKTDGESIYFEAYVPIEEDHLKLVTFARSTLKTGVPIYIYGDTCSGKTILAKEIGSYEFEQVIYISPESVSSSVRETVDESKNCTSLFFDALSTFTNRNQLLILDEYPYLESQYKIKVDKSFMDEFKGSLIVISQLKDKLPSFQINEILYSIEVRDLKGGGDFELQQHTPIMFRNVLRDMIISNVNIHHDTPDALTTIGALWFIEERLRDSCIEEFFLAQYLRILNLIEEKLYRISLIQEIPLILDLFLKDEPELKPYTDSILLLLDHYLLNSNK